MEHGFYAVFDPPEFLADWYAIGKAWVACKKAEIVVNINGFASKGN